MVNNVLLSPSNCRFSPTMHPWLLGSALWEKEHDEEKGCLLLKEACQSLSRHIQPSTPPSKWDPQQGLLCLRSLFIYSCSPWKTFSLIPLLHPPHPTPPLHPPSSFSLKQGAFGEFLLSKISSLTIRKCEYILQNMFWCVCLLMSN